MLAHMASGLRSRGTVLVLIALWLTPVVSHAVPEEAAFGLARPDAIRRYAAAVRPILAEWSKLTVEDRASGLVAAVNAELTHVGVLRVQLKLVSLPQPLVGRFHSGYWQMQLDKDILSKGELTAHEKADLAALVYHEGRHAEQYWLVARWLAGEGLNTGASILTRFRIRRLAADRAARKPLAPKSHTAQLARSWFESRVRDGDRPVARLIAAHAALARATGARPGEAVAKAQAAYDAALAAYRAQLLEADAFRLQAMILMILVEDRTR